jgi:hypothetical protein
LSVQLVGNSFVSPTPSLSLSPKHPAALSSPKNSFSRSAWSAGRWGLWCSYCCCCRCRWCVVCCCCLSNGPGACLLLAAWFRRINRPSTHTHTYTHTNIEGGGWVGNKQPIHAVMWIERWRTEIMRIAEVRHFTVRSDICLLCADFVIEGVLEPRRPTNRPIAFTSCYSFSCSKNWLVD